MQFKLKDVFVDAVQWFEHGDHPAVIARTPMDGNATNSKAVIQKPTGDVEVKPGDFIVTDSDGSVRPINMNEFNSAYEPVKQLKAESDITDLRGNMFDPLPFIKPL